MKVTSQNSYTETKRYFDVEDGPLVDAEYFSPPKKVRVNRGCITYTWQDGEWIVPNAWAVEVSGPVLKKDGTASKAEHARRAKERPRNWSEPTPTALEVADDWGWLQEIIDLLQPVGGPTVAELTGHEVNG
jgi:hypothetical protein